LGGFIEYIAVKQWRLLIPSLSKAAQPVPKVQRNLCQGS
jgi:hypothetical protein